MTDARLVRPSWRGRTNVDALTIAAIEAAERKAGHEYVVTQGSYQGGSGEPLSAGTHDGGGVVDLRWCGHFDCLAHLRRAGLWSWHRTPDQGPWPDHIHGVIVGHPLLAPVAARQIDSARRGRDGLASSGPDDGPRVPVVAPVWPPAPEPKSPLRKALTAAIREAKEVSRLPMVRRLRKERGRVR